MAEPQKRDRGLKPQQETATLLKLAQDLARELHPYQTMVQSVALDSSLDRDLGLDSLARVELLARIERAFGVTLSERVFADAETPRDLLRAVQGASGRFYATDVTRLDLGEAQATPHTANTLVDVLDWHVQAHPDRPHIQLYADEEGGTLITYRQLKDGAEAVAAGLQQRELHLQERVAIMLPSGQEYFFSFFGILLAGGIPVPLYPPVRPAQIEDHLRRQRAILTNCQAVMLVTVPEAKRLAQLLKTQVETLRSVVTVDELSRTSASYQAPSIGAEDIAFLQYTSGSTGVPKGVVLTHANLLANMRVDGEGIQAAASDVFVSWLPLYHDMGLIGAWLSSMYFSLLVVIMSPIDFLTRPQRWLWAIHRCGGTISAAPNFAYELCLRRIEEQDLKGLDLSSWRVAFNGAEPVSPDTVKGFCERFAHYGFRREAMLPVYGLAECSVGLAFPPLDRGPLIERIQRDPFLRYGRAVPADEPDVNVLRMVACGRPLLGHQIRVVDPTGQEVPERQEGRLQFRGPSATSGYFRNPGETRRLFDGDWLESGDLAYLAGGEVYITGRIKDVIIRAGRNIYPHELEEAVGNMPGIRKGCVAVFGTTDPDSGTERFIVLAETREKEPKTLEQLTSEINALTVDLVGTPPDDVVLAPPHAVPKTSSGKIRRAASREIYERGQIGHGQRAVWWQVARVALAGLVPQLRRAKRAAGAGFYAAYAWLLFLPLVPFTWLSTVLLPRVSWRWAVMHHAFRLVARAAGTRIFIRGFEDLPPRETPRVLVANHGSYLDAFYLIAAWPHAISFVAKAELAKSFFSRIYLQGIQTEFVERSDTQQGIADAKRVMQTTRSGKSLLFFPEGGFTRIPGLLRFRMGAFVSAVEAEVPLVPVAIRGTRSILRDGSWLPRRGSVTITIGKPIDPKQIAAGPNGDAWTRALKLRDAAREHILRYCGEPDLAYEKSPV